VQIGGDYEKRIRFMNSLFIFFPYSFVIGSIDLKKEQNKIQNNILGNSIIVII